VFVRTTGGSVEAPDGRVVSLGVDRFISAIAHGDACFICGVAPAEKRFNDEHVIPNWILKRHELHSRRLVTPNKADLMYGRNTVPCCIECNALMANSLEKPISEAFRGGYTAVCEFMRGEHGPLLFVWLASLFLKTHLKDRELRWNLDERAGGQKIAECYDWAEFYHNSLRGSLVLLWLHA